MLGLLGYVCHVHETVLTPSQNHQTYFLYSLLSLYGTNCEDTIKRNEPENVTAEPVTF